MTCDFYKISTLLIILKNKEIIEKYLESERNYYPDYYSDSDCEFDSDRYLENQNYKYPPKILYENNNWIKPEYQKKFILYLNNINIDDILTIKKIYSFDKC